MTNENKDDITNESAIPDKIIKVQTPSDVMTNEQAALDDTTSEQPGSGD